MHESDLLAHAYSDSSSAKIESSLSQMEQNSIIERCQHARLITFLLFQCWVNRPGIFESQILGPVLPKICKYRKY